LASVEQDKSRRITRGPLTIDVDAGLEACVIRLVGELDMSGIAVLEDELDRVLTGGSQRVVLDLESLSFVDSTGLSCLVRAARHWALNGDRLRMRPAAGEVDQLFRATGVRELLPLQD
jgi:anti-sigma B factor antagonist